MNSRTLLSCLIPLVLIATFAFAQDVPVTTLELEELWRIGGPDDEENLLGVVDRILADDEGNLYLLDIQLVEVLVYDADGEYVHSLGKQGDGPGEMRNAVEIMFLPDGHLGIVQLFPGRVVKVDLEGIPAGEIRPGGDDPTEGGFFSIWSAASYGDRLVLGGARMQRDEEKMTFNNFIGDFEVDGSSSHVYLEKSTVRQRGVRKFDEMERWFPNNAWTLDGDGRLYLAPERNNYRIEVYGAPGEAERTLSRPFESWQRTDDEMDRAKALAAPRRRRNSSPPELVMEPTEPDIAALHAASDGSLWVLTSRGTRNQPAGVHSTWDVFDPAGDFTTQVAVACEGRGGRDALFFPGNGLAVLVKEHADARFAFLGRGADNSSEEDLEGEASPLEIICYRLVP